MEARGRLRGFSAIAPVRAKWLALAAIFAMCVGVTFISYQPYLFEWDDADYFARSILVSEAFWHWNPDALVNGMVSIRPPVMTWMGLPWGALASWNAAGNCFITLASAVAVLAAACLYLLLRIGVKPYFLVAASVCVAASLGPFPPGTTVHHFATGFVADSLFAWTALVAVLLIPYEARTPSHSIRSGALRGILWGAALSWGTMTKLSFLYFAVLVLPALLSIRIRRDGTRTTVAACVTFSCCSAPSVLYLLRWGRPAFDNAKASSFGRAAEFSYIPILQFLGDSVRESPSLLLSFLLTIAALIYLVLKRRLRQSWPDWLPLLIMVGFGIMVLAAPNRQIRYAFPVILALPYLVAILISGETQSTSRSSATVAAGLAFCGLFLASVPTQHRPNWQSIVRSEAVLDAASRRNASRILLATDSPTLNGFLMDLAREFSDARVSACGTLAYQAMSGAPIEQDYLGMSQVDMVVFQDPRALSPPYTNQRVPEYERYAQRAGFGPVRIGDDISVYLMRHGR